MGMYHDNRPGPTAWTCSTGPRRSPGSRARDRAQVTLTYDWSEVPDALREHIGFLPFDQQHLDNSLQHLAGLAVHR
jgi:hypothetical protein